MVCIFVVTVFVETRTNKIICFAFQTEIINLYGRFGTSYKYHCIIYAISVAANNLSYFLKYQFSTEKFNHDNSVYVPNNDMRKCIQLSIFSSKTYSYFIFEKSVQEHVYSIYQYYWIGFRYGHVCQFTDKFLTLLHVLCTCVCVTNPLYKF